MKAVLKFDLDDEQEKNTFRLYCQAEDMYLALNEIADLFRLHEKYDGPAPTREEFYSILNDHNVNVDLFP